MLSCYYIAQLHRMFVSSLFCFFFFFFFNDTATTEIYTLSLHDALPIWGHAYGSVYPGPIVAILTPQLVGVENARSEEHTSELQSHSDLVCRLLLEKKKQKSMMRVIIRCRQ